MILKEIYTTLGLSPIETDVKIYQFKEELQDEIEIFDNIMNPDEDHVIDLYLDKNVLCFTWYPQAEWLEVHLEAEI